MARTGFLVEFEKQANNQQRKSKESGDAAAPCGWFPRRPGEAEEAAGGRTKGQTFICASTSRAGSSA
jgi:hypothetical protein